ncbi:MAG: hypothetical protein JST89_22555 [Cyanobacteria bacterium SZAS-4]|nr:hypothetical protein [Cyanobacteria bacterium SZAS-4]
MNGEEVFERTAQKYADCRTYSDSGRIESNLGVMTFKTFFVRPNLFKFEFAHESEEQGKSGIIWSDGNEFFTSYNHDLDNVPCDNISSLLVEIGLAAQPASYLVPMMLMPDYIDANSLSNAAPYLSTEHTSIADRSCHRIKSSKPEFPYVADLLIDSLGYKLRRMIVEYSPESKAQVIFTDVSFDREISEDIFNLKHARNSVI